MSDTPESAAPIRASLKAMRLLNESTRSANNLVAVAIEAAAAIDGVDHLTHGYDPKAGTWIRMPEPAAS